MLSCSSVWTRGCESSEFECFEQEGQSCGVSGHDQMFTRSKSTGGQAALVVKENVRISGEIMCSLCLLFSWNIHFLGI